MQNWMNTWVGKTLLTTLFALVAAAISHFIPALAPALLPVLTSVALHWGVTFAVPSDAAAASKKPPSVPPGAAATFMVCALTVVMLCSLGCGWFGSGGALAPVAACAPSEQKLLDEVGMILLEGGDYEAKLENLALTQGAGVIDCAVQALVAQWTKPTARADEAHQAGAERGRAHLARKASK